MESEELILNSELDFRYFWPEVLQVVPTDDYGVYAYFNDGSIHYYDVKPLIKPNTVFEVLQNINIFKSKITILNDTVAWDIKGNRSERDCIDIDVFKIFNSKETEDPLTTNN